MITTGFTLAILTTTGFYLVFRKLPYRIRRFMQKHVLLTDVIACLATYMLFGSSLIALFAAAWAGIIISMLLALTSNPVTNQMLERFGALVGELKDKFISWAAEHFNVNNNESPELKVA